MTEVELAWAAGFFDGEGSIGCYMDNRYHGRASLGMQVVQTGPADTPSVALLRFKAAMGGRGEIYLRRDKGNRLGTKPLWVWRASTEDVKFAVRLLAPYLTVKLDDAALAVAMRLEYEGLLADRRRFCKKGHEIDRTGFSRARCRTCHNDTVASRRRERYATDPEYRESRLSQNRVAARRRAPRLALQTVEGVG